MYIKNNKTMPENIITSDFSSLYPTTIKLSDSWSSMSDEWKPTTTTGWVTPGVTWTQTDTTKVAQTVWDYSGWDYDYNSLFGTQIKLDERKKVAKQIVSESDPYGEENWYD